MMKDKSNFIGPVAGSAFCLAAMFFAQFVPDGIKSSIGFIFGVLFAMFIVWYHMKDQL